jgi:hypothetical protein
MVDIKLMNGFGFIEFEDPIYARDIVPGEYMYIPISSLIM